MPGTLNSYAGTDFLSRFELFRTTFDTDPDPASVTLNLEFGRSKSAQGNSVVLVANRLTGTGKINYKFYVKFAGVLALLPDPWFLHKETGLQDPLTLIQVDDLFGSTYRVVVEHEDGVAASFETNLSASSPDTFVVQEPLPPVLTPESPAPLTANFAGANPVITWTTPEFADEIEIWISSSRGALTLLDTVAADSGPYTDLANLSSDTTICYAAKAKNEVGTSTFAYTVPRAMILDPIDDSVAEELTLTWDVTTGGIPAESLGVEIWASLNLAAYVLIDTVPFTDGAFTHSSLTTTDHYDYKIREVSNAGNGDYSNIEGADVT